VYREEVAMKTGRQKWKWVTALVLWVGFLLSFFLDLTGLALHQWLGVAGGLLAGYHLVLHWDWVKSVARRWFGRTSRQARIYFLVDAGLMLGLALIVATGVVISSWLSLALENYSAWRNAHVAASIVTLLLVVGKIGLHWRMIVNAIRQLAPVAPTPARPDLAWQPATAPARMDRRSFLKLMGAASIPAVLAIGRVLESAPGAQAEAASQAQATPVAQSVSTPAAMPAATATTTQSSTAASTSSCTVRCNKRCSYPGNCRRYVDTNKNNRCDLGECV
jgi:hypothetical protein